MSKHTWTLPEGITLARLVEPRVSKFNLHVALTGGLLYKEGERKDCDLVLYRAGGYDGKISKYDVAEELGTIPGLVIDNIYTRTMKGRWSGMPVDFLLRGWLDPEDDY